ncbi:LysR family transcriptional regulator [Kiloniella sp.]|uniref:LysR family transcriptional regulator n=1 Tax=Kiloniella sp. TaxID=1938587 RepID=UPI003A950864
MADRLNAMRLLSRVIERGSFTAAAKDLNIPRSTATDVIQRLEQDLGVRLLDRTTRHVSPTLDGKAYYERCLLILADIEEAEDALRGDEPSGVLRIDAHGTLTRTFLLPHLSNFFAKYPKIELHLGQSNRLVNLVKEGVDCVIRAGIPDESGMIMRQLTHLPETTCASPEYLDRYGVPKTLDDLDGHRMIAFMSSRTGKPLPLEFQTSEGIKTVLLKSQLVANDSETIHELALMGYGLVQAPRYRFFDDIKQGNLKEVLSDCPPSPMPLAAFYPQNRQLSPRVRVFVDWAVEIFKKADLGND